MSIECNKCNGIFGELDLSIICEICKRKVHNKCLTDITDEEFNYLNQSGWKCEQCMAYNFPFHNLDSSTELAEAQTRNVMESDINIEFLNSLVYSPFDNDSDVELEFHQDIDPDDNYYSNFPLLKNGSNYYTDASIINLTNQLSDSF